MWKDQLRLLQILCCFLFLLPILCQSPCNDLWWGGVASWKCFFDFRSSTIDLIYPDLTGITYISEESSATYSLNGSIVLYSDGLKLIDNRLVPPVIVSSILPGNKSSEEPAAMFPLTGNCSVDLIGLVVNSLTTTALFGVDITAIPAQIRWSTPLVQFNGTEALEIVEIPVFPPEQWILLLTFNSSGTYLNAIHINAVGAEVKRVITYLFFNTGCTPTFGLIDYNKYSGMLVLARCFRMFLCNFNNVTGVATNIVELFGPPGGLIGYAAALPGEGRYVYFGSGTISNSINLRVYQIDLQDPLLQPFSITSALYSGMTEGPNGKLYLSAIAQPFIGVIENPSVRWQDIIQYTVNLPTGCLSPYFFAQKTYCFSDFPPRILCTASPTPTVSSSTTISLATRSPSRTQTPTNTATRSPTPTRSSTRSLSTTSTLSRTNSRTRTGTATVTPSNEFSNSRVFSLTSTRFPTSSRSFSFSTSSSVTPSQSVTPTSSSSQTSSGTTSNTVSSTNSMNPALPPQQISATVSNGVRLASSTPSPVMAYLLPSSSPSSEFVAIILPNNVPTAVDIVIQPGDVVAIDRLPVTSNPQARSEVFDITFRDQYGMSIQPPSTVEICFIVPNIGVRVSDLCLASYSENTEKWKCDDCVRKKKKGSSEYLCGHASHLTNFAILLSDDIGSKGPRNCDPGSEINAALAYTALGCILYCLVFIALALAISRITPIQKLVRGNEGNRAAKLRSLALANRVRQN